MFILLPIIVVPMFINIHPQAGRGRRSGIDGKTLQASLSDVNNLDVNVFANNSDVKIVCETL